MTPLRVSFKTVGCRLNRAETALMTAQFEAAGYEVVPFGAPCEVCVVHGCAVTRNAERDSAHFARQAHRGSPCPVVVLAGCAAEVADDSQRQRTGADLLAGQKDKYRIPDLLAARFPTALPGAPSGTPGDVPRPDSPSLLPRFDTARAWIKVQDGCDFRCAYCIVPLARGAPWSRPFGEVLDEVRRVCAAGYREIVLSGANLGCYRDGDRVLVDLLTELEAVPGVARIRLSSIEITTAEREIIDFMAGSEKLCRFLHLPLQSGDDRILAAMGRRYSSREYRAVAEYAAGKVRGLGLGSDILAGFPGEDEAAFRATVRLIEDLPFSNLHVFPYSKRSGTRAEAMPGQIPEPEKKARVHAILELGSRKRDAFARQFVGREVEALIETIRNDGAGTGWTSEYLEAVVHGHGIATNQAVRFIPSRAEGGVLTGELS